MAGNQRARLIAAATAESLVAVAIATGAVALLKQAAPVAGLGVVYLLAVLVIAIHRGEWAALGTAVVSVLTLNYFFIPPIHELSIARSENVVALGVFLIVAVVVGRLAAAARDRAAEAERRALLASAREAEAELLASIAAMLLRGRLHRALDPIAQRIGRAMGDVPARIELVSAPTTQSEERAVRIPLASRPAWLYVPRELRVDEGDVQRIVHALAGIMDVALERERLASQAAETEAGRRADVAKTAILHAISHDLRSPLTAITTAAEGLDSERIGEDDRRELIGVVREESARLARLVDDLLDLSRVEANAVNPQLDWCDLHDVVGRVAAAFGTRGEISLELPAELPLVRADAAQLERVFSNLLDNALRFSPDGLPVRVTGGTGGGKVTVRVIDQGPGIPSSHRARVFDPFVRARRGQGGSGLGLTICRGFVEANGGRLSLQTSTGTETAFAVSLPLVEQPAALL
jgi:two-component system, OmpR family, sensor histidine kinase KdpD